MAFSKLHCHLSNTTCWADLGNVVLKAWEVSARIHHSACSGTLIVERRADPTISDSDLL